MDRSERRQRRGTRAQWLAATILGLVALVSGMPVRAGEIRRGVLERSLILSGTIEAREAQRFFVPAGRFWQMEITWLVEEGSFVESGDPVARFDTTTLAAEIEQARNTLLDREQTRALKIAQGQAEQIATELEIETARIAREKARLDAAIPEELLSRRQYARNQLALDQAEKVLAAAIRKGTTQKKRRETDIRLLDLEIEHLQTQIARDEEMLGALELTATTPGIVIYERHAWFGRKIHVGDKLPATSPLLQIPDLDTLEVHAFVSESDRRLLTPGLPVRLRLDAAPRKPYAGQIVEIQENGEVVEAWGKATYFPVRIRIDDPDSSIMRPGMSVQCVVVLPPLEGVLLVPLERIEVEGYGRFVRGKDGQRVPVAPLGSNDFEVAIPLDAPAAEKLRGNR
ncbi:MAG: HlyD family efflux transporter periplasmic adaptor subunit [Deltaproteobacteria bacterium]|nr:MAG: HlyD family efflux transporter periplasmic adaptor subunit [Deltaproteobacteria bacterium]